MKQTRLWIGTIAMLLCNLLPIHAENVVVRLGDWTSTNHSHNSTSSKTYTFTAVDGAILSFDWWVDSGFSGDLLIVTLDGTTILEKGGYQSGTCNKAITQGEHTLVVKYTKDGSASSGLDQARVSNLTIAYAIDGLVYSTANNTASVIGAIDIAEVVIPSNVTINDTVYIVASIGDYAFHDCSSLTSITIPESVTSIGNYAFDNCTALKKVIIEDGNTTLSLGYNGSSQGLFYDCPLEEVYLGRNLSYSSGSSYGYSPFYKSNRFPTISLGNNVTSIPSYLFYNDTSLTSITIPESVTSIGNYAFDNCTALKKVIIEDGSTTLSLGYNGSSQGLFYDCPLEEVYLGRNLSYSSGSSYGYSPFYESNRFPTISLGNNVTSIPSYLFYNNTSLISITIPEGVTSIGNYAFDNCTALKEVIFEDGSEILYLGYNYSFSGNSNTGQGLFYDCPLESVYLGRNLSYGSGRQYGYSPFYNKILLTTLAIGENVTSIGESAFYYCSSLTSITIPEGSKLTSIKEYAFSDCSGLTSITIPRGMKNIKNYAFSKCTALKEVFFEDGSEMLYLGNGYNSQGLFYDCPLESVYLGRNLSYSNGWSFGYSPFYKNGRFPTISLGDNITTICPYLFYNNTSFTAFTIPESVTSIGDGAFCSCSLNTITIPEGVTSIGNYAFDNCTALKEVIFEDGSEILSLGYKSDSQGLFYDCPLESVYLGRNLSHDGCGYSPFYKSGRFPTISLGNNITAISQYLFYGNKSLTNITLPKGVTYIGYQAFGYCINLTSTTIPENVTRIEDGAFIGCISLKEVIFEDGNETISLGYNYRISGNSSNPGQGLFYDCPLESVYLGRDLSYYCERPYGYSPFYKSDRFPTISLGDNITSISPYLFLNNKGLTTISIPESVTYIGEKAFFGCSLTAITCKAIIPPTIEDKYTFDNVIKSIPVYVPTASVEDYKTTKYWSDFTNIMGISVETDIKKKKDNCQPSTEVFDLTGRRVENPTKGIYIVNGKRVVIK